MTLDAQGNYVIAEQNNNRVVRCPADTSSPCVELLSSFSVPLSVARIPSSSSIVAVGYAGTRQCAADNSCFIVSTPHLRNVWRVAASTLGYYIGAEVNSGVWRVLFCPLQQEVQPGVGGPICAPQEISGSEVGSAVGPLDFVRTVAVDENGTYLLIGGVEAGVTKIFQCPIPSSGVPTRCEVVFSASSGLLTGVEIVPVS